MLDLSKVIEKKQDAADYMGEEITKVIKTFGKRDPGSEGEKNAVEYMAKQLEDLAEDVKVEPFDVYPASFMSWIYISITFMFLAIASYFFVPILSLVLVAVALVLMIGQFILYRKLVDKLFVKKTSYNITAIKKPVGEVKRRLFYNGHPDAAYEWPFVYYFGGKGMVFIMLSVFAGIFYVAGAIIAGIILRKTNQVGGYLEANSVINILGYIMFAFVPFFIAMLFFWNEKRIVDGANDNLTGCYMGIAVLKALKESGIDLENTEVGVIISGSEEAGLRGAKAWSDVHKGEFEDVPTYIFAYDTIREGEFLSVNVRDLNGIVKADPKACDLFRNGAIKHGIPCSEGMVPFGATDSAAFNQGGFKAVGITAMNHDLQKYYHTRDDSYDNLDKEVLANCFVASVQALEDLENEARNESK